MDVGEKIELERMDDVIGEIQVFVHAGGFCGRIPRLGELLAKSRVWYEHRRFEIMAVVPIRLRLANIVTSI